MSELKTLKDLKFEWDYKYSNTFPVVDVEELKKEAIKWIKEFRTSPFERKHKDPENWYNNSPLELWIKHFFNIKEEELE